MDLDTELDRVRDLDVSELAGAVEFIDLECARCGACCKGCEGDDGPEPHTTTVFPGKVHALQEAGGGDSKGESGAPMEWRDVAQPMSYGLVEGDDGPEGETFEWAFQTITCGDCQFYKGGDSRRGAYQVHENRSLICETYPFSVALGDMSRPMGEAVDEEGVIRVHEYEGLGRDISRANAEELARAPKERAVRKLHEARGVTDAYELVGTGPGGIVVHGSEDTKRPGGARAQQSNPLTAVHL